MFIWVQPISRSTKQGLNKLSMQRNYSRVSLFHHIVTSPLSRAHKTAEIIAETIQKPITIIDDLQECHWGVKQGKPVCTDFILEWMNGDTPEGAETAHDFDARIRNALKHALGLSESVLIVAHGGVYCSIQRALFMSLMDIKNSAPVYHRPPENPAHSWLACDVGVEG